MGSVSSQRGSEKFFTQPGNGASVIHAAQSSSPVQAAGVPNPGCV